MTQAPVRSQGWGRCLLLASCPHWPRFQVPCLARKQNSPGILNIHWKDWLLKFKLQYFGHLMERADSLEKTLMLGNTEGKRRRGWQRMRWLDSITNSMDLVWARQGSLVCCSQCNYKELNMTLNEQLKNKIYNCCTPKAIRNLITMPMMSVRSHRDYSL